jgi:hypothetical protein
VFSLQLAQDLVVKLLVDRYVVLQKLVPFSKKNVVLQGDSVSTRALLRATHHHLAQIRDVNSL